MSGNDKRPLVPRLRFPEFRKSGAWRIERMGKLYSFMRNNVLSRDKLNYEGGIVKNIHYGDIHTKFSTLFDITKEYVPYINSTERLSDTGSDDYCIEGDMIFADSSEDTNDVGKSIEIVQLNNELLLSGQHTILARRKGSALIVGFGGYLFQSRQVRLQIQKEAQGTKVYAISPTRLANIKIAYPDDEAEQQKIADCLTSLDEVIAVQGRKVEALKAQKRGLMQQLFPREGETIPRLRFPEFGGVGEWVEKLLNEVCEINPAKTIKDDNELVSFIPMAAVSENGKIKRHEIRIYAEVKKGYTSFIDKDVIVEKITPCFENGKAALVDGLENGVGYGSTEFHVFRARKGCLPFFLFLQIYRENVRTIGAKSMVGNAGQRRVPASFFEAMPFYLPPCAEQQKIADCLSSLDDLIAAQTQKLDALKTHKKGLMQQLFPSPENAET